MIGNGVEPDRCAEERPTTLQEAKPKAGSSRRPNVRWRGGPQTGVEAQKSKPYASPADRFCRSCYSNRRSVTPTKINRGGSGGTNGTWARTGRNAAMRRVQRCAGSRRHVKQAWRVHPDVGANLRRARRTPRTPSDDGSTKGKNLRRPARLSVLVMGSGTPREEGAIWRMTRCGRRNPGEGARVVRVACERDDINAAPQACEPSRGGCRKR